MLDYWSLGIFTFPAPARVNCYIQFSFNIELDSLTAKSVSVSKCVQSDGHYEAVNPSGSERLLTMEPRKEKRAGEMKGAMPERTKGGATAPRIWKRGR